MITAGIVLASIFVYVLIGILVVQPALGPLFEVNRYGSDYPRSSRYNEERELASTARLVIVWASVLAAFWPITWIWSLTWMLSRKRIPQVREKARADREKLMAAELARANQTIEEFRLRTDE